MADKVLLTGISGWIAKHIAIHLLKSGYEVLGTVRENDLIEETKKTLASQNAPLEKLSFVKLNLLKSPFLKAKKNIKDRIQGFFIWLLVLFIAIFLVGTWFTSLIGVIKEFI